MNLLNLIQSIKNFIPAGMDSPQTIKYIVDCRCKEYQFVDVLTKTVQSFPIPGSNAFLGNWTNPSNSFGLYKIFRLSLNDVSVLKLEDIEFRISKIQEALKNYNEDKNEV